MDFLGIRCEIALSGSIVTIQIWLWFIKFIYSSQIAKSLAVLVLMQLEHTAE